MSSSGDLKRNLYHHTREWKATDDPVRRAEILEMAVTELMMFTRKGVANRSPAEAMASLKTADRLFREWASALPPICHDEGWWYVDTLVYRQALAQTFRSESLRTVFKFLGWDWAESVDPTTDRDCTTIDIMIQ